MARVFISYRREDTAGYAGWLNQLLSQHLGQHHIFRDIDSIEPGLDFVKIIEQEVGTCEVLIALIGKQWLHASDSTGRRRLDNRDDYVRNEIAIALSRNIRVIPVLVQGAAMPQAHELPADLSGLSRRNALELRDTSWQTDVDRLIKVLERVLGDPHQAPPFQNISSPPKMQNAPQSKGLQALSGQAPPANPARTSMVTAPATSRRGRVSVGLIGAAALALLIGIFFFILRPLASIGFANQPIATSAPVSGIPTATRPTEAPVFTTVSNEIPRATAPAVATPTPTIPPGYELLQADIPDGTFDPKTSAGPSITLTAGRPFKFAREWYGRYCRVDVPPDGLVWVPCGAIGQADATPIPTATPRPPTATPVPSKARTEAWSIIESHVSSDACSSGHTSTINFPVTLKFDANGDLVTYTQFDTVINMHKVGNSAYRGVNVIGEGFTDTINIVFTSPRSLTGDWLRESVQATQTCRSYYTLEGAIQ